MKIDKGDIPLPSVGQILDWFLAWLFCHPLLRRHGR